MAPEAFLAWRTGQGLTQVQAGERCNVQAQTINRWEHGKTAIPAQVAAEIAEDRVEEELGPGQLVRGSDLLPKAELVPMSDTEIEYVWMGGQRVALPPGEKPTTAKQYADRLAPRDVKTGKPTMKLIGPYKGGPIPKGFQVVRVCRVPTDPKGSPWAKGKTE